MKIFNDKKFLITVIIGLLSLTLAVTGIALYASSSDSDILLNVDFPSENIKAGETFEVTVSVTNKDVSLFKMAGIQIELSYDSDSVTPGTITPLLSSSESLFRYGLNNGRVVFVCVKNDFTDVEGYSKINDLFKVEFTAKKEITPSELFNKNSVRYLLGDVKAKKILTTDLMFGGLESSEWYLSQPDGLVYSDTGVLFRYKGEAGGFVEVPDTAEEISSGAFAGQNKLKYVYVPASVTTIGEGAFDPSVTLVCDDGTFAATYANANSIKRTTVKSIEVTSLPYKYLYKPLETFDRTGMTVTVSFNDGGTAEAENYTVSEILYTETGTETLTVSCLGETATFKIRVILESIPGDANGDGYVKASDIVRLKKYIAANGSPRVVLGPGADADGNGVVDALDVVRLKRYFAEYDPLTDTSSVKLGK